MRGMKHLLTVIMVACVMWVSAIAVDSPTHSRGLNAMASSISSDVYNDSFSDDIAKEVVREYDPFSRQVFSDAKLEDDFADDSIIVVLDEKVSEFRRASKAVSRSFELTTERLFGDLGKTTITDLTEFSDNTGESSDKNFEALNDYYSRTPFRQILHIQLETKNKQNVLDTIAKIEKRSDVVYVGPDRIDTVESTNPNDPQFRNGTQWHLNGEYGINAPAAWGITTGSRNIRVGIIDTGIATHDDLNVNLTAGWDFYNSNSITTDDTQGHGTQVAGIIGAVSDNNLLGAGIAQNVTLVPLQAANPSNNFYESHRIAAINYARLLWGTAQQISVINHSLGGFGTSTALLAAIQQYPGLFVWSAGNDGDNLDSFANIGQFKLPNLISVGAHDKNGARSVWNSTESSSYGATSVDIFAPGGKGTAQNNQNCFTTGLGNGYSYFNGTSCSAPMVAGVAALLRQLNPNFTIAQIRAAILDNADALTLNVPGGTQNTRRLNAFKVLQNLASSFTTRPVTGGVEITGVTRPLVGSVEIPSTINGQVVVAIGNSVFANQTQMSQITIPASVTKIGDTVFYRCSNLTIVNIPNVTSIGTRVFYNCTSLTSINTPNVTSIGTQAFFGCTSLTSINIPNVTSIGTGAFTGCSNLVNIFLPYGVTTINESAFSWCSKLTIYAEAASKPSGWHANWNSSNCSVVWSCSSGTPGLSYTPINGGTSYAVSKGTAIAANVVIPYVYNGKFVTEIGAYGFREYFNMTIISIPNTVTSIGDYAFFHCERLQSIGIPSVTSIGTKAFYYCTSLTSINAPNVTSIGTAAFYYCNRLTSIDIPNITSIGTEAFYYCTSLTSISIPNVTSIGTLAFYKCTSLTSINMPNLTSIGSQAFNNCTSLTSINIPNVTSIESYAFNNCTSLTSISIPNVTSIESYAFNNCTSLTSINIPNVTSIGSQAFQNCTGLTSISIPKVTSIGTAAFHYCNRLTSIDIPNITSIGSQAFYYCTGLTSISIPKVTSIGTAAFHYCNRLTSIDIPNITSIGTQAFSFCASLTSINIPNVTSIGSQAFYYCTGLTSISIPNVTSIESYAFNNCTSLVSILLPHGVTTIGEYAFSWCSKLTIYAEAASKPSGWHANWNWNSSNRPVVWSCSSGTPGLSYTPINSGMEYAVSKGTATAVNVKIPYTYNGKLVTEIGVNGFREYFNMTSISIPNTVTSIKYGAFINCIKLNSINIPNVTNIEEYTFYNCISLTSIAIPSSVTSIESDSFNNCIRLTSINIPSVTSIGAMAFYNCASLNSINIPSVASIGTLAFYNCSNLTSINIPNVTSIEYHAFINCTGLTSISIPNVTSIESNTFINCTSLTNINMPNVTSIGSGAFTNCSSLVNIIIPYGVTTISDSAFSRCSKLTIYAEAASKPAGWDSDWNISDCPVVWSCAAPGTAGLSYTLTSDGTAYAVSKGTATAANVVIPYIYNGKLVTEIESFGFEQYLDMTSISIPNTVTSIRDYAFYNCKNLQSIIIPSSVANIGICAFLQCSNLTIYAEVASKPAGWSESWNISKRPVIWSWASGTPGLSYTPINGGMEYAVSKGTATAANVVIPSTYNGKLVTEIGSFGFRDYLNMTSISIPNSVTSIKEFAFYNCNNLQNIIIPSSVTNIGTSAFFLCSSLTIYAEASSKPAGWNANWNFSNCPVVWGC